MNVTIFSCFLQWQLISQTFSSFLNYNQTLQILKNTNLSLRNLDNEFDIVEMSFIGLCLDEAILKCCCCPYNLHQAPPVHVWE